MTNKIIGEVSEDAHGSTKSIVSYVKVFYSNRLHCRHIM